MQNRLSRQSVVQNRRQVQVERLPRARVKNAIVAQVNRKPTEICAPRVVSVSDATSCLEHIFLADCEAFGDITNYKCASEITSKLEAEAPFRYCTLVDDPNSNIDDRFTIIPTGATSV